MSSSQVMELAWSVRFFTWARTQAELALEEARLAGRMAQIHETAGRECLAAEFAEKKARARYGVRRWAAAAREEWQGRLRPLLAQVDTEAGKGVAA